MGKWILLLVLRSDSQAFHLAIEGMGQVASSLAGAFAFGGHAAGSYILLRC